MFFAQLPFIKVEQQMQAGVKIMDEFTYGVIAERKKENDLPNRTDLLSRYLCLRDDDGKPFSDKYLRDIVTNLMCVKILFFLFSSLFFLFCSSSIAFPSISLAGRDTTSQLLTWACFLVSYHPETERKLVQEIQETLKGELPNFHNVKDMKYLKAVLNETLR
jgi:fatty acid omega-hydroxylase